MILVRIEGEGIAPAELTFAQLLALPGQVASVSTLFHGQEVGGVRLSAVLALAPPPAEGFVIVQSTDGFSTTIRASAAHECILVYRLGAGPLPATRGGPVRLVVGDDARASLKFVGTLKLSTQPGSDLRPTCAHHRAA
ncbi:MAG TPA: molybdopterin-dependent oxidoreductase [Polyangia bacterium]|nr:molybdopterin-dependent oxidoreductase [Polyangia bacterium]